MILHKRYDLPLRIGTKEPYISTVTFNKTSFRSFNIVRVLALPQDNHICRLKRSEERFERTSESIRDRLDLRKMGALSNTQFRCENPRLFNVSPESLLHNSEGVEKTRQK